MCIVPFAIYFLLINFLSFPVPISGTGEDDDNNADEEVDLNSRRREQEPTPLITAANSRPLQDDVLLKEGLCYSLRLIFMLTKYNQAAMYLRFQTNKCK